MTRSALTAPQRRVVERAARADRPYEDAAPPEVAALAGALGDEAERERARRWLDHDRHVRLSITGEDLLDAGVPAGPEVGAALARALEAKRAGAAPTRHHELRAALGPLLGSGPP